MKIYGTFKDRNNDTVTVTIYNINKTGTNININTDSNNIRFSDNPVTINTECEDTFSTIIKKSCTIELVTKTWLGDYLFADNITSIVVNVVKNNECLFAGYVTANTYNQDYSREWETIEINCVDNLSILEQKLLTDDTTYESLVAESKIRTFKYLINKMKLRDTTFCISNLPQNTMYDKFWVETSYERVVNDTSIRYYVVETQVKKLDNSNAITTNNTRVGNELTVTYVPSEDTVIYNGLLYYKNYAYVTINGQNVNTGDYVIGDLAEDLMPTVVDTVNVFDGWTYGPTPQPFEYYEHFRIDNVMSDGSVKYGENDIIGDRILETPNITALGSYYEFRQSDRTDLINEADEHGDRIAYYKNYAWIIQTIDGNTVEQKTGDWVKGNIYILGGH